MSKVSLGNSRPQIQDGPKKEIVLKPPPPQNAPRRETAPKKADSVPKQPATQPKPAASSPAPLKASESSETKPQTKLKEVEVYKFKSGELLKVEAFSPFQSHLTLKKMFTKDLANREALKEFLKLPANKKLLEEMIRKLESKKGEACYLESKRASVFESSSALFEKKLDR